MKTCTKCHTSKPLNDFSNRSRNKDGKENICKLCKTTYDNTYYRNKDKNQKLKRRLINKIRKSQAISIINKYLTDNGCIDCGYNENPAALQFDHQHSKKYLVSDMVRNGFSIDNIFLEIQKCEVRCANCHLIKTARDFKWYQ